jgi:HAD superfamily hydrolase (TIGR01459 family)
MIKNFSEITNNYEAFLLDAYGVFWGSSKVGMLPGAKEAMENLIASGKKVGILSNATQLASKAEEKFSAHGLNKHTHYNFILTSGEITKKVLTSQNLPFPTPKQTYYLFGSDHPNFPSHSILFQDSPYQQVDNLDDADFIYIHIPHINGIDQEEAASFREMVEATTTRKKLPVLCSNPDQFAHEGSPARLVVRQGSIAKMFEENDFKVSFIGKPYQYAYEEAFLQFDGLFRPEEILMIGDTPETDIRGAKEFGMATALVTKTGIIFERLKGNSFDVVVDKLPKSDQPQFFIERLELS